MANETKGQVQNTPVPGNPVVIDAEVLKSILQEVKQPYVDPKEVARKEAHKSRMKAQIEENARTKKAIEEACGHMREDNTSAIAWMKNSDEVTRGVCQRCNTLFTPEHPDYMRLIRVPVRGAGVVYI